MNKMINYCNEEFEFKNCPACAYAKHEFCLPCGIAYEDENYTLSQDWKLPIPGFLVVSPKRHIEKFIELSGNERIEIFSIVNKTIKILQDNNVCDRFNVIFEEKENRHFHIWIMPRYKWMKDLVGNITENIGEIFDYAERNLKTSENIKTIKNISDLIRNKFSKEVK